MTSGSPDYVARIITVTPTLVLPHLSYTLDSVSAVQSGAWTATIQEPLSIDDNGGSLTVDGTFWQATQPVSGTFWQTTQPVSGTFWQATQPVSLASVPSHNVTNAGTFVTQINGAALTQLQTINSLVTAVYDYIALGYTGTNLTTVVYKTGGSGGTTVSTLTLAYTGARLDSVTKT